MAAIGLSRSIARQTCRARLHRPLMAHLHARSFASIHSSTDLSPAAEDYEYEVDHLVIGAGVVGLAIAERLAARGTGSTLLIEKNAAAGQETRQVEERNYPEFAIAMTFAIEPPYTILMLVISLQQPSSRNSEVIHAGLYYPEDSLKTKLCIRGSEMMYDFCAKYNIDHRQVTKWVVGQNESDLEYLENLSRKAHGLLLPTKRFPDPPTFMLTQGEMLAKEPHVSGKAALVSPRTGIVDVHGLMQLLEMKIQDHGGDIVFQCEVTDIERIGGNRSWSITGGTNIDTKKQESHQEHQSLSAHPAGGSGFRVRMNSPAGAMTVKAATVVNSAGLHSDKIYNMLSSTRTTTRESNGSEKPPLQLHYCKGHYYGYSGPSLVSRLIYPVPDKNLTSLGTHLTLDLAGRMRFGPDVLYIDRLDDYTIDPETMGSPSSLETVSKVIQAYLPAIKPTSLYVDYAGIRPKLAGPGESFRDFMIENHDGVVHLVGIESPGLTSSLAIAEYVEKILY